MEIEPTCDECHVNPQRSGCPCGTVRFCCNDCHVSAWVKWHRLRCGLANSAYSPLSNVEWKTLSDAVRIPEPGIARYAHTGRPLVRYGWYPRTTNGNSPTEGSMYLPVVRYETDASGSTCEENMQCGVQFSYEPNSATWLDLGRVAFFPTIVAAFFSLRRYLTVDTVRPRDAVLLDSATEPYRGTLAWYLNGGRDIEDEEIGGNPVDSGIDLANVVRFGRKFYGWFPRSFDRSHVPAFDLNAAGTSATDVPEEVDGPAPRGRRRFTPLCPSYGSSLAGVVSPDSTRRLFRLVCQAARTAHIDTIVVAFHPGVDDRRVETTIISVDRNPYARLAWAVKSVEDETALAVSHDHSRCERLNRGTRAFQVDPRLLAFDQNRDADPELAAVWFPEDGILYGKGGVPVIPYVDEATAMFVGFDIVKRPVGSLAWIPTCMPS